METMDTPSNKVGETRYMTLTKKDGTVISHGGVTLPDGTRLSHKEYSEHLSLQEASNQAFDEAVHEETGRHHS